MKIRRSHVENGCLICLENRGRTMSQSLVTNQFWQHDNRPIELWSQDVLEQKVDYTHNNPVMAGLVLEPWHWKYSSAIDYSGGKGLIDLDL